MKPLVAFLSMGRLVLLRDGKPEVIESQFVREALDRELERQQRNEWKQSGGMEMLWGS
jgi:hypothetical protein